MLMLSGIVVKSGFGVPCFIEIKCLLHLAIMSRRDCHDWSLERQMLSRSMGRLQQRRKLPWQMEGEGARVIISKLEFLTVRGVGPNRLCLE